MGWMTRIDAHADLMHTMADTLGADLGDALVRGAISAPELRNAVMACTGCEQTGACRDWLRDHAGGAAETPAYCRNHDLMDRLRGA